MHQGEAAGSVANQPGSAASPRQALPESFFPLGGPTGSSWRERALARAAELDTLCGWLQTQPGANHPGPLVPAIRGHLDEAKAAANKSAPPGAARVSVLGRVRAAYSGSSVERVLANLDAAEADLLRLAPPDYVRGQIPYLLAHVRQHLVPSDPRRAVLDKRGFLEKVVEPSPGEALSDITRGNIIAAVRGASLEARREYMRVHSFRNVLLLASLLLTFAAAGVAVLGIVSPKTVPLCFAPSQAAPPKIVCPTGETPVLNRDVDDVTAGTVSRWDLALVEVVGLVAAAVAGAAALRQVRGTSTPYSLPVALAVLKLPTGALTAVLGLLLMRGQFVPGLSALDTSAQIIAWGIVFGYGQQLFTRLVDQQAHRVLDDVGGADKRERKP
jgi:hypothetical protein